MVLKQRKFFKLFLSLIFVFYVVTNSIGCSPGKACTFFAFSYPPGTKPHESNWEYYGLIFVYSDKPGSDFDISEKTLRFIIEDKGKNKLLNTEIKFANCGGIGSETTWDKFEELYVTLYEKIVKSKRFERNEIKNLDVIKDLKIEKFPLCKLKFKYNTKDKQFHLSEKVNLGGFAGQNMEQRFNMLEMAVIENSKKIDRVEKKLDTAME